MTQKILFGTYTNQDSKGVYQAELDEQTAELSNLQNIAEIGSPTYIAQNNHLLYAVDRSDKQGGIAVIDLSKAKENNVIHEYLSQGSSPAYVAVDSKRKLLFVSYYHRGSVEVYQINEDQLSLVDIFENKGSGPRPEQTSSHIHFSNLTPDNKLVLVDLGTDEVIVLNVSDEGKLIEYSRFQTEAGFGPRHIRFTSDGKNAVLLGELSSKLSLLSYAEGHFELKQTVNNLPENWQGQNGSAAIRISGNDKFVYASNRGHNSISVFRINETKDSMKMIQNISVEGEFPRDFNLTKDEKILIVANQNTNNATTYFVDSQNGELTLAQKNFYMPEGVAVKIENDF